MTAPSVTEAETGEFALSAAKGREPPASAGVRVDAAGRSHPGTVRPNNEDHYLIARFGRFLEVTDSNLPTDAIPARAEETGFGMAVADGMGGAAAGEVASRLALTGLVNLVLHTPDWILRLDSEPAAEEVERRAAERFEGVNRTLAEEAEAVGGLGGFGTTLTLAFGLGRDLFVAHLGDSRAYLYSGGELRQITRDHTLTQAMVERGMLDRRAAATHHLRHMLTQYLGDHGRTVRPDVTPLTVSDGDRVLLCTDGLTDMVGADGIAAEVGGGGPAAAVCRRLIDRALAGGGEDNVTVAVACYAAE